MANKFQLLIYKLSVGAPLAIVFAAVWYLEKKTLVIPVLCLGFSLIIIILLSISFIYAKHHLPFLSINITGISSNDAWIIGYMISYLLPLASIALTDFDYRISVVIAVVIIIVMLIVNSVNPNPLLLIAGYHFYTIESENGIKNYLLISKQKLRNKNQIKSVRRVFEYLLIDERG